MAKIIKGSDISTLTSVDVITEVQKEFKKSALDRKFSQQKLVNRAMYLYVKNEVFRKIIEDCFELKVSGSQF